jgi:hypothetical protein
MEQCTADDQAYELYSSKLEMHCLAYSQRQKALLLLRC